MTNNTMTNNNMTNKNITDNTSETKAAGKRLCVCGNTESAPYCENSHEQAIPMPTDYTPVPKKVLLMVPPYSGTNPTPVGALLEKNGYSVIMQKPASGDQFKKIHDTYFKVIKEFVGGDGDFAAETPVLTGHMWSKAEGVKDEQCARHLKHAVMKSYDAELTDEHLVVLDFLVGKLFGRLSSYLVETIDREKPGVLGLFADSGGLGASLYGMRILKECYPPLTTVLTLSSPNENEKKQTQHALQNDPVIDHLICDPDGADAPSLFLDLLR